MPTVQRQSVSDILVDKKFLKRVTHHIAEALEDNEPTSPITNSVPKNCAGTGTTSS
jgi:hypothetical protein